VAMLAEKRDHHPDFSCSYSQVTLELSSHDAGGVTARDVELARAIEGLLQPPAAPHAA
jgi:4a-hydroxytetrahydrobiopterin dehydratase